MEHSHPSDNPPVEGGIGVVVVLALALALAVALALALVLALAAVAGCIVGVCAVEIVSVAVVGATDFA